MAYVFRQGDPKAVCDRCGFDYRLSQLRKEWTGLKVCPGCFERRHPQDFVRGVPDRQAVRDPRPAPEPVFIVVPEPGLLINPLTVLGSVLTVGGSPLSLAISP